MTDETLENGSPEYIGASLDGDADILSEEAVREASVLLEATDFREYLAAKSTASASVEERMESESEAEFFSSLQDSSTVESNDDAKDDR